ncbi:MAG: hypothetical protein U1E23_16235 [Reyranellaceae bacterium]
MTAGKPKDTYGYLGSEAGAVRDELHRLAGLIEDAAKAESADAMKAAAEAARQLADRAGKGQAELEAAIRENPLAAVALAGVAGFVLALLVRR